MADTTQHQSPSEVEDTEVASTTGGSDEEDQPFLKHDETGKRSTPYPPGLVSSILGSLFSLSKRLNLNSSTPSVTVHRTVEGRPDIERLRRDLQVIHPGEYEMQYTPPDPMLNQPSASMQEQGTSASQASRMWLATLRDASKNGLWIAGSCLRSLPFQANRRNWVNNAHSITLAQCESSVLPCDMDCESNPCETCCRSTCGSLCTTICCTVIPPIVCLPCVPCVDPCCGQCSDAIQETNSPHEPEEYEL